MLSTRRPLILTTVIAALVFVFVAAPAVRTTEPASVDTGSRMTTAAQGYLATLGNSELERGTWSLNADERFDWHFVPRERYGVRLKDMTSEQRVAAHGLLKSALSSQGYLKATGVMQLEGILGVIEGRPERRDPEDYYFNVFGTPSTDGAWAWRFEGHHVSLNFTAAGDDLPSLQPAFLGSNPHVVGEGPNAGQKLLGAEEGLARELLALLDARQLRTVIFQDEAPSDIITGNARTASMEDYQGIPVSDLNGEQREAFRQLLEEYLHNTRRDIAHSQMDRIQAAGLENLYFGWAGSTELGEGHYYRIHGPTILIEYDNVQGEANHVHSVWRDLENDFGADLLRRHYAEADHHQEDRIPTGTRGTNR
ncbi:uncharacterized protein METZ01_LOCUS169909 [marine metagenome]|uniref:DUF3500 domain-containing protein n=1 Tax=marine metagenome TaxID=408172 RepID=A0A382BTC3_9ZZZZ